MADYELDKEHDYGYDDDYKTPMPGRDDVPGADTKVQLEQVWFKILPHGRKPKGMKQLTWEMIVRRKKVTELWAKGKTNKEIGDILGIKPTMISIDLRWVQAQYLRFVLGDVTEHIAAQVARLDVMEQQLWAAWDQSFENEVTIVERTIRKKGEVAESASERREKGRLPHPMYMALLLDVHKERSKLLGLYRHELTPAQQGFMAALEAACAKSKAKEQKAIESRTIVVDIDEELEDWQ